MTRGKVHTPTDPAPPVVHLDVSWPDRPSWCLCDPSMEAQWRSHDTMTREWASVTCTDCRDVMGRVVGLWQGNGGDVMTGAVATDAAGEPQATVRDVFAPPCVIGLRAMMRCPVCGAAPGELHVQLHDGDDGD